MVKFVFWRCVTPIILYGCTLIIVVRSRILLFYILSIAIIGLNGMCYCLERFGAPYTTSLVPWNYPGLSNRTTTTSPFTIVFKQAGSST